MVPHLNDFGVEIFPKCEMPQSIFDDLEREIPFFRSLSNPARMSLFGKEFLIHRTDILKDFRKGSII